LAYFVPDGYEQTFGVLPEEVKQVISHRARALAAVKAHLRQQL
jgi:XTP/dITP diphosphohydrolase